MVSNEECKCIDNIMDTLVSAQNLSSTAKRKFSGKIIKNDAILLNDEIKKLESSCSTPLTHPKKDFFMKERYIKAKYDLEKVIITEGEDSTSAITSGEKFYNFLLDNAARMINCPKK